MSTATQQQRTTLLEPRPTGEKPGSAPPGTNSLGADAGGRGDTDATRPGKYRCECGHLLRVFGGGRHRVYFEPANTRLDDPVMNRACPACGRGLPGKNAPV